MACLGIIALFFALRFEFVDNETQGSSKIASIPWQAAVLFILLVGVSLWLLRGSTHFLGNGYTHLTAMAGESPIIKWHETGECLSHLWLAQAIGGNTPEKMLLSYQIISVLSGVIFLAAVMWAGSKLFEQRKDQILFVLGLATAGYMLLFFGYVENRSLLTLFTAMTSLVGLVSIKGKVAKWWVIPPALLAIFSHIFGVVLIPPVIYLILRDTKLGRSLGRTTVFVRILIALAILLGAAVALRMGLEQSLFFSFALMQLQSTKLTISGYTLFSLSHLADYLNLLSLLLPGALTLVVVMFHLPMKNALKLPEYRFGILLVLSALGLAFIFDPKLGMPRDWDLFAFAAIPLATMSYFLILDKRFLPWWGRLAATLAIALGALCLGARVATQAMPGPAIAQITDYIELDKTKGKNAFRYLENYYRDHGDSLKADSMVRAFNSFPDERLYRQIDQKLAQNKYSDALHLGELAVAANPMSSGAYNYIGSAYYRMGRPLQAGAAFDTALGLNPHNVEVLSMLGTIRWQQGRFSEGEDLIRRAANDGPTNAYPLFCLSQMAASRRQYDTQLDYLVRATGKSDATKEMFGDLFRAYLRIGQVEKAAAAYRDGSKLGLDTTQVQDQLEKHPELRKYLEQPSEVH